MTTVLVLSDIHGKWEKARDIAARHPDAEYVFIAGDLTNFGSGEEVARIIDCICRSREERTVVAVAGNCDTLSARKYLAEHGLSAENRLVRLPIGIVAGLGGGLKRAGVTPYERTESELRKNAESLLAHTARIGSILPSIMLSHSPPHGSNADLRHGQHVGSFELANLISVYNPQLWICGHIHESPCFSMEDKTLIVNPGPCGYGNYAILNFEPRTDGSMAISGNLERIP